MAYQTVQDLDADITVSLGGINKKTGKKNPSQAEGYYLGYRKVDSKKDKKGFSYIYFFQTQDGSLGVWGKTDLDRKMAQVKPGTMTLIKQTGTLSTPNGEMYRFSVAVDSENTIEVNFAAPDSPNNTATEGTSYAHNDDSDADDLDDAPPADEPPPPRAAAPARPASVPDAARQKKVQDLLNRNRT